MPSSHAMEKEASPELVASLKEALAAVLEVRPANPLIFLLAYFRRAAQPDSMEALAYLLNACPRSRGCFQENVYSTFVSLKRPKAETLQLQVCDSFLRILGAALPEEIMEGLLEQLRAGGSAVHFNEFNSVVEACIAANEALEGSNAGESALT
ncbi:EF-hand domain-containing protein [Durusdinium trenchii]|uniref:EF-hand domain-containing protein n=2 Tax=Durusdinium trenchii TaxID=1381693 RepID=A0ABP0RZG0_9DINO